MYLGYSYISTNTWDKIHDILDMSLPYQCAALPRTASIQLAILPLFQSHLARCRLPPRSTGPQEPCLAVSLPPSHSRPVADRFCVSVDIAVGAPHDGMSDEGAVYIFHGTKSGINKNPTQVRPEHTRSHAGGTYKAIYRAMQFNLDASLGMNLQKNRPAGVSTYINCK